MQHKTIYKKHKLKIGPRTNTNVSRLQWGHVHSVQKEEENQMSLVLEQLK